jgi:hypothetical protein
MTETSTPGLLSRIAIAFAAFFRALSDATFASNVQGLREGKRLALPAPPVVLPVTPPSERPTRKDKKSVPEAAAPVLRETGPEAALLLLALLQREGRFVDFLEEDVSGFSDAQIGAAARVVHTQCRAALREHLPLEPVRAEDEGAKVTLEKGFDARRVRVVGQVAGEPPYTGTLTHRGWRVREVKLGKVAEGHDAHIVAPAEVEL